MKQNAKTKLSVSFISAAAFMLLTAIPALAAAPTAPTNLTTTAASQTQINLSWTDNSSNETGFKIERSPNGSTFTQIATVGANVTTYASTGLTASTTYYYRVRAYTNQNSAYTNVSSATTLTNIPSSPSALSANPVSYNQINLSWTDNADNESGFLIERGTDGVNFTQIYGTSANVTNFNDTSVSANTTYYYRVRAWNGYGNSGYTNTASTTTPNYIPPAPSSLYATSISQSQINLTWADNAINEDGYKIEMGTSTSNFVQIASIGANTVSYSATGLNANTTYYFRVRAYNNGGNSSYSSISYATTWMNVPVAPSSLSATAISQSQINLGWTDNSDNETAFLIERGTDGVNFSFIASTTFNSISYSNTSGLSANTTYYYRVRAYHYLSGFSSYSNTASATTLNPPAAPSVLNATAISQTQINLSWMDNSGNETGFKIEMGLSTSSFSEIGTVGADVTSFSATNLSANTTYYFRVRAYNADGNSSFTSIVSKATWPNAPIAPTNLGGSYFASSSLIIINLNWTDNSSNETGFKVERGTDGTNFSQIGTSTFAGFSDNGNYSATTFYYRVKAYNLGGESDYTNVFQIDIP